MTLQEALFTSTQHLRQLNIPSPERDARILMARAMGLDRTRLSLHMHDVMSEEELFSFEAMIAERGNRKPISHILGGREFYGRWFKVTADVLDPRPDTEALIDIALAEPFTNVLDLGTGSGAIIVTLLAERPKAIGIATDISENALGIAAENAKAQKVENVAFEHSHWFESVGGQYDLIVSNPPYIAADEMSGLDPDVRDYEPRIALTDDADGLTAYRNIAAGVMDHLTPNGRLLVEIGPTQAKPVSVLLASAGLENITVHPDLDGRDRVISAIKPA